MNDANRIEVNDSDGMVSLKRMRDSTRFGHSGAQKELSHDHSVKDQESDSRTD